MKPLPGRMYQSSRVPFGNYGLMSSPQRGRLRRGVRRLGPFALALLAWLALAAVPDLCL